MAKTLTILLLSDAAENEDADYCLRLAEAVLRNGYQVNIFLYSNGVYLGKKAPPPKVQHTIHSPLLEHIQPARVEKKLEALCQAGAVIHSCHANEYARGIESAPYVSGIKQGNLEQSFCDDLLMTDVLITLGH